MMFLTGYHTSIPKPIDIKIVSLKEEQKEPDEKNSGLNFSIIPVSLKRQDFLKSRTKQFCKHYRNCNSYLYLEQFM